MRSMIPFWFLILAALESFIFCVPLGAAGPPAVGTKVTITTREGTQVSGPVKLWQSDQIVLGSAAGDIVFRPTEVIEISPTGPRRRRAASSTGVREKLNLRFTPGAAHPFSISGSVSNGSSRPRRRTRRYIL